MIGRGPDGLYTYTWDSPSRQWRSVGELLGALGDAEYGNPSAYGTVTLADIDGRPGAELIARGYRGVKTWRSFAPQYSPKEQWFLIDAQGTFSDGKGWGALPSTPPRSASPTSTASLARKWSGADPKSIETYTWDAQRIRWSPLGYSSRFMQIGWSTPDKYLTIQLADLDGDTKAELVGRGPEGIESYSWNGKEWVELGGASLALSDLSGWNTSLYSTIQFADVTGDGGSRAHRARTRRLVRLEVHRHRLDAGGRLAESAHGVGRRRLAAPRNVLDDPGRKHRRRRKGGDHRQGGQRGPDMDVRLRSGQIHVDHHARVPEFTGAELDAYRWIGNNRFEKKSADIRAQYDNTTYTSAHWTNAAIWLNDNAAQPPAALDISASEWSTVARQLEAEFSYVEALNTWFGNVDEFLGQAFAEKSLTVATVTTAINIPSEDTSEVTFDVIGLILNFGAALVGLGGPEGEVAEAVLHIVHSSMEAAVSPRESRRHRG